MASSDYISRKEAEKVFSQPVTMSMCLTLEECKQKNAQRQIDLFVIRGLPAADVRPIVRGKWIKCRKNYSKCSECGTAYSHPVDWTPDKYCSECGARLFMED